MCTTFLFLKNGKYFSSTFFFCIKILPKKLKPIVLCSMVWAGDPQVWKIAFSEA